jgi:hypothetical protein
MSARVVFRAAAAIAPAPPFDELARAPEGVWGVVDDHRWMAQTAPDGLELLYLSPAEYAHAVRGLSPDEVARAVAHRRRIFAADVPGQALGLVEQRVRGCLAALPSDQVGARTRGSPHGAGVLHHGPAFCRRGPAGADRLPAGR